MLIHQLGTFELDEIVSRLSGNAICKLLMCGCTLLSNKINTNVVIRRLKITLKADFRSQVLPSFVNQYPNLESLHIDDQGFHYMDPFTSLHLLSIPSRPTSFGFFGNGALQAFIEAFTTDSSRYNNLTSLSLSSIKSHPATVKFDCLPPTLTFLNVISASDQLELRKLPSTLTHLSGTYHSVANDEEPSTFPASLTKLDLILVDSFPLSVLQQLPKGSNALTSLHINCPVDEDEYEAYIYPFVSGDVVQFFSAIPQNLTSLRLKVPSWFKFSPAMLPKNLTHLQGLLRHNRLSGYHPRSRSSR